MARLILSFKGRVLGEYPVSGKRMTIGRRPHNDIRIDNLAVSGEHAAIVPIHSHHFVQDLDSTNGTRVNGEDIKKHLLEHNDVIQIGKYELRYVRDEEPSEWAFQKTIQEGRPLRSGAAQAAPAAQPESPQIAPPRTTASLRILNGPHTGKQLALTRTTTTLGRQGSCLAVIVREGAEYYISRGDKSTIPLVNERMVSDRQLLKDGDVIEVDRVKLQFMLTRPV